MHTAHRKAFLARLAETNSAAIIPTGDAPRRNGDSEYRYRPESDFVYLTGFREPNATLVLLPNRAEGKAVLFLQEKDPEREVWTGRRLGLNAAPETLGIDEARPIAALWDDLPALLEGHDRVVYQSGIDEVRDREMLHVFEVARGRKRRGGTAPSEWTDPDATLHELRLFKSDAELECMRKAAAVSVEAHIAAMREAAPGKNEGELDALLEYTFRRRGGTGASYSNIVAGGANACILHYVQNDAPLVDGELVLIDAGAEWNYYASDVTRTFPVNGRYSREQRALYEVVLAAQRAGIELVRPGGNANAVHDAAVDVLVDGLLDLGLLTGSKAEVLEQETYSRFYMHKTGHWLGLDVHDCGAYFIDGEPRAFEPGMVQTVEPGLYVAPDDTTVDERWRGIGIRIEDDVLVTKDGREVLTSDVPTEVDEIEAICAGR